MNNVHGWEAKIDWAYSSAICKTKLEVFIKKHLNTDIINLYLKCKLEEALAARVDGFFCQTLHDSDDLMRMGDSNGGKQKLMTTTALYGSDGMTCIKHDAEWEVNIYTHTR